MKTLDSTPISGQIFLILILNQFSQRRKMRLEQANLITIIAKLYGPELESGSGFSGRVGFGSGSGRVRVQIRI